MRHSGYAALRVNEGGEKGGDYAVSRRHMASLPACMGEATSGNARVAGRMGSDGGLSMSKLVMVIDDSPTVRKIIEVSLRREGFDVVSYPDGVEALRAITTGQLNRLPDLLFLDIELPRMNGFEVARHLRSQSRWDQTAIVMISRRDGIIDRVKARLAGTQAYLTKPFTTQMVINVVATTLGLHASLS